MNSTSVDQQKCIGCGVCVTTAPKSFKLGDDGKSQPLNPPGDDEVTTQNAINSCPVDAISWADGVKSR